MFLDIWERFLVFISLLILPFVLLVAGCSGTLIITCKKEQKFGLDSFICALWLGKRNFP